MQAGRAIGAVLLLMCGAALLALQSTRTLAQSAEKRRRDFVGDAACKQCHLAITETYFHTAHHLTSQLPDQSSIAGSFVEGSNTLNTGNPDLHFRMEERSAGFYETAVFWQPPDEKTRSERIDIVAGSGEKGQTYLYWKGEQLFELPLSYWTSLHAWVNSPGFTDGVADFNRPIVPRCLECHATYFTAVPSAKAQNFYRKSGFVLGISCERCHGPGGEHVQFEKQHTAGVAKRAGIVNPAKLLRDRQIEVCAQCHGGIGESLTPAFSYLPGQALEKFIRLRKPDEDAPVDVHGNQVALAERSRCYQSSEMTCSTCHDVHAAEKPAPAYSEKCLGCHKEQQCGEFVRLGEKIRDNCVDCHMPLEESDLIISQVGEKQVKARMRNHWIKVYAARNP